ncbi:hypothetical protein Bca101_065550 [Brassica carinata]
MQKSSIDDAVVGDVSDRGLQFSDNDHAIGNSVESCKDGSKSQNCPERSGMMQLEVPEIGKNDYNVCKLFYDTSTGDDASTGGIKRMTEAILVEILERLEISHNGSPETADPMFYVDKNDKVCDLLEIVFCYKENTFHVTKDIYVSIKVCWSRRSSYLARKVL